MQGIPVIQIRGSSLLLYDEPVRLYSNAPSAKRRQNMKEQAKKAYSGGMSMGSRKRLAKAITIMTQAIKPRWIFNPVSQLRDYHNFSFVTLTVASQKNITARFAYDNLLGPFLDWLTKTIGNKNPLAKTYIWKAELQKRGQIHYHITTPAFIHWRAIRTKWNELQHKAGLLDQYALKHGHFDPNGTDIHKTTHIRKMDRYLIKELAKSVNANKLYARRVVDSLIKAGEIPADKKDLFLQEYEGEEMKIMGKVWGCSEDLAGAPYYTLELTRAHERKIQEWIDQGKAWKKTDDFFEIVYCDMTDPPDLLSQGEKNNFEAHLKRVTGRADDIPVSETMDIPAACVDMELLDILEGCTWKQIELAMN